MVKLKLPDGSERVLEGDLTGKDLLATLEPALKKEVICLSIDGELADLGAPLPAGTTVSLVRRTDPAALEVLRHSTAHIMAQRSSAFFLRRNWRSGQRSKMVFTTILTCHGR